MRRFAVGVLIGLMSLQAACAEEASTEVLNIVVILTDDAGWNSLSIRADPEIPESGSTYYQTPNLDRLAKCGIRFSMAYSAAAVCDPSRTSLQYGMTPTALNKFATVATRMPDKTEEMKQRLFEVWKAIEKEGPDQWWKAEHQKPNKGGTLNY